MKIGMISLGCAKNLVDSELFLGVALKYGMKIVNRIKDADIIVVNTCGFIESAKKEAIDTILEVLDYQKDGKMVIAMGCFVERYLDNLKTEIPEVDYYLPIRNYSEIDQLFKKITNQENSYQMSYKDRVLATPKHSAYVRIGDGCNNNCAYCAIPLIRGRYISRSQADIEEEVRELVNKGIKEITLIAQDTTRYGSDLTKTNLAQLLRSLSQINNLDMLRVLYLYPDEITDELIEVIKTSPKIAKYFDIPIQHASDNLLRKMNRRGNQAFLKGLFNKIRTSIPGAIIRTSIIVGFPGETNDDFKILLDFVRETKFERLGVFTYSDEEDTLAFSMTDKVSDEVKQKRYEELMLIQQTIAYNFNQNRLNQTERVLIDRIDNSTTYLARSYMEAPDDIDGYIYVTSNESLSIGEYYNALITQNLGYDLKAIIVKEEK